MTTTTKATQLAEDVLFLINQGEDPATLHQRFGYKDSEGLKRALLKVDKDLAARIPWGKSHGTPPAYLTSTVKTVLDKANATGVPELICEADRIRRDLDSLMRAVQVCLEVGEGTLRLNRLKEEQNNLLAKMREKTA